MLWSITLIFNLCPHAATLLIKGPTQPVLEGQAVTLECLYSDAEFNISQVRFEVFSKVSCGNKWASEPVGASKVQDLLGFAYNTRRWWYERSKAWIIYGSCWRIWFCVTLVLVNTFIVMFYCMEVETLHKDVTYHLLSVSGPRWIISSCKCHIKQLAV